jgi:tape measure domain-containing protein
VAKYTADIEIAVRGGRQIDGLIKGVNRLNNSINVVNKNAKLLEGRGFNVASMENYSRAVNKATSALNRAAAGTQQETLAVKALVTAIELENNARARRERLIAQEVANRRRVQATADAGFGIQGPQAAPIRPGRGPASPIGGTVNMPGSPAALRAAAGGRGGRLASRLGGAVSGAAIGGAFPLLFGQSGGAAAGGAIGGLAGGLLGPGGSFAGSLVGTILGDIAAKGNVVKQLGQDIGFSAEQTKILEQSFKQAGREFDKFEASVQAIRGVGLAVEDQASAIQAASQLTETYGGKIDKITNAFAAALSSGKVTQATLNQLTQQGIPIQEKLAATYGVSRSELLAMAKDGEISVQKLADAFIQLANEAAAAPAKLPTAYDQAFKQIQQAVNDLVNRVTAAFKLQTDGMATSFDNAVSRIGNAISQLIKEFTPLIETAASIAAAFINVGTYAASALLSIPGYVSNVINAVSLMIPGLSSVLFILQSMQNITGGGKKAGTAADYGRYAPGFMQQALPKPISNITVPSQLPAKADKSSDKARKEAERAAERIAKSGRDLDAAKEAFKIEQRLITARKEGNTVLELTRQAQLDLLEIRSKGNDILANKELPAQAKVNELEKLRFQAKSVSLNLQLKLVDAEEKANKLMQDNIKKFMGSDDPLGQAQAEVNLLAAKLQGKEREYTLQLAIDDLIRQGVSAEDARNTVEVADELNQKLERQVSLQKQIQDTINQVGQTTGDVLQQLIFSTDSWADSLTNALNALAKVLFQAGLGLLAGDDGKGFFSFLTGGLGRRAAGGPVTSGSPYIVGERGPELFVPGRSGTIVPNNKLGGGGTSVVVNVDASGSKVQGDDQQGNQLGRVIAAAVQQELIKQKRPGGLLV